MTNLPKTTKTPGIQLVSWTNADGSTSTRYRVRIQKNEHKANRIFETLEEAKQFILVFKSDFGRKEIDKITQKEQERYELIKDLIQSQNLQMLVSRYIEDNYKFKDTDTHEARRIKQNQISFLNTIIKTKINKPLITDNLHSFYVNTIHPKIEIGQLKAEDLSLQIIDDYIKARREKGIKGISIERELTIFSNFIKSLKRSKQYQDIKNVALEVDKSLLTQYKREDNKLKTRKKAMSEEEQEKFFSMLDKAQNPDLKHIVILSLMTAMRRSEIVNLTWEQVDFEDSIIYLPMTKNGQSREVVLTQEAKEYLLFIKSKKVSSTGKIFSYKNASGFEGTYRKIGERFGMKVNFHKMRAEAFTRFFNQINGGSETMLAKFLGISNVSHFVKAHKPKDFSLKTEKGIITSGGHSSTQVTFNNYLLDIIKKK